MTVFRSPSGTCIREAAALPDPGHFLWKTSNFRNTVSGIFYSCFFYSDAAGPICCSDRPVLRQRASGDHSLSHLHGSKAAAGNSKIIASSGKAWCVCDLHDSSLARWLLNQHQPFIINWLWRCSDLCRVLSVGTLHEGHVSLWVLVARLLCSQLHFFKWFSMLNTTTKYSFKIM